MHNIKFKSKNANRYNVMIDGVTIELSMAMNKIAYGDYNTLSVFIDNIEQHLQAGLPLALLSNEMNGVNMLRMLIVFYHDMTLENWLKHVSNNPMAKINILFEQYFGFRHNATKYPSEFGAELTKAAVDQRNLFLSNQKEIALSARRAEEKAAKQEKRIQRLLKKTEKEIAVSKEWAVIKKTLANNVVLYEINGHDVDMCLSGHSSLDSAKNVMNNLSKLKTGFDHSDSSMVRDAICTFGGKASFQVMELFFFDQAMHFFESTFELYVLSIRCRPNPCSFLKSYFGGSCGMENRFYLVLLSGLEKRIPSIEEQLVQTSVEEMHSSSNEWKLFYRNRRRLSLCLIRFPEQNNLKNEMIQFFHHLYNVYSSSGGSPYPIIQEYDTSILKIIEGINRPISSAIELSSWDYRNIIASLLTKTSISTIRSYLFNMRRFLYYLDPEACDRNIPLCIIPSSVLNPRKPLSSSVIRKIAEHSDELPEDIWLAFQVFAETGARAGSLFDLTVDDLSKVGEKWIIRIFYKKAMARRFESDVPSYVVHELSNELAKELLSYIQRTEHLRNLLPEKYIFVYSSTWFRPDSSRLPSVLTSDRFSDGIQNLCTKHSIYDSNGMLPTFPAQSIRAEVGRALFAKGASPETVAAKLGNSAPVAKRHYDSMYPADEASMRRKLYAQTIDSNIEPPGTDRSIPLAKTDPMYGSCSKPGVCMNANDCRVCTERILK